MKKINLLIIGLLFFQIIKCNSQVKEQKLEYQNDNSIKEIGIGLVQKVKVSEKVTFFKDPDLKQVLFKNFKFGKEVIPLLYKVDYNILFFVCVEKNNKYYKVAIGNSTCAYIKPSDQYLFYDWVEFLKNQVTSVESKNIKTNPFYNEINGKVIQVKNLSTDDEIEVIEVKDSWIKIQNNTLNKKYWLKWKENNKILIYLNLLI